MAMQLISDLEHNENVKGEARKIWMWHAIEETEHRSVTYDLLYLADKHRFHIRR